MKFPFLRGLLLALFSILAASAPLHAASSDYQFKIADGDIQQGDDVVITISLVDLRTNKLVEDAVIFTTRLDMAPDGMEAMTTSVTSMESVAPGLYRFKADLAMAGNWRFQVAAKVQGETETVTGEVILGVAQ